MAGFEDTAGINVSNYYGPRATGQTGGVIKTEGIKNQLSIQFTAADIGTTLQQVPTLPAGSKVVSAYLRVIEAFALGGTTPTLDVGTEGSETTNNIFWDEAQAEGIGFHHVISPTRTSGTWNDMLAADTIVGIALGGSTPTVGAAGIAEVIIEYAQVEV